MIGRRQVVHWLGAGLASTIGTVDALANAQGERGSGKMPKVFPPFELQADHATLQALSGGLRGFALERMHRYVPSVWLQGDDGHVWLIQADTRDLQFKFEVFTLAVTSLETLQARFATWTPPVLPKDLPENFRQLFAAPPEMPSLPSHLEPWPFERWRCDVLRRVEFIVEDVEVGSTFGRNPNLQSAAKPSSIPPEASAICEVAAGLVFTGSTGNRLLVGVDWTPANLIWTQDSAEIDAYMEPCETVGLDAYIKWLNAS